MNRVRRHIPLMASVVVYLALYAAASVRYEHFFSLQVFVNFFDDNASLGLAAIGMTFVILAGGIDLSVGSLMALSSVLIAVLVEHHHWPPLPAVAVALAIGAALGMLMGLIIHCLGIAPFIVTLAGMFLARGLALTVRLEPLPIDDPTHRALAGIGIPLSGSIDLPVTALVFLLAVLAATYLAIQTAIGRTVYAVGGDEQAARLMGLPVGRTKVTVYAVSGLCSAGAGALLTLYQSAGNPSAGIGLELDAIAAVVIGGTLLTGGVGTVPGTMVGVLILGLVQTVITFEGTLSSWWTRVVIGLLLLVFVVMQKVLASSIRSTVPTAR